MGSKQDLIGKKFSRLTVVREEFERSLNGSVVWQCLCDCGVYTRVPTKDLNSGNSKSCGCLNKETLATISTTHGMSKTRQYGIYAGILSRCNNANDTAYNNYGGRGIRVCTYWAASFENFWNDMSEAYTTVSTLERKDVNLDYSRENCEWISKKNQALNKRRYSNNKSGYTGISEQDRKYGVTLVATIQNPETGKAVIKTRNLSKISRELAITELLAWLEVKRKEFGYKTTHGSN